jgi:hypothetical protein
MCFDQTKFLHGAHTGSGGTVTLGHSNVDLTQMLGGQLITDLTNVGNLANVLKQGQDVGAGHQITQDISGSRSALGQPDNNGQPNLKDQTLGNLLKDH